MQSRLSNLPPRSLEAPARSDVRIAMPLWIVVVLALAAMTYWRFVRWEPTVFYGDDLYNVLATLKDHTFASEWQQPFTTPFYEKYRPVFELVWLALVRIFQTDLRGFLAFNFGVHLLNAMIFFVIAMQISNGNKLVSLGLSVAFAGSRFALYQITQATGTVEAIALTLFLLTITWILKAYQYPEDSRWQWLVVVAFFLCIHTHERYIALTPVLAFMLALSRHRCAGFFNRYGATIVCVAIPLFNALVKTSLLHLAFFVGTGATHIDMNVQRTVEQAMQAVLSVVGFNYGPEYLAGHSIVFGESSPGDNAARLLATLIVCSALVATTYAVLVGGRSRASLRWYPIFTLAIFVSILVPPIVTVRLEQRWLYAPLALFLLLFAWAARLDGRKRIVPTIAGLVACLSLLTLDILLSQYTPRIFFISSGTAASLAKRDIVDAHAAPLGQDLLLHAARDHCKWTLDEGRFFELYEGQARKVYCALTDDAFDTLAKKYPSTQAFAYTPGVSFTPVVRPK
jgi:hypothetical protein